LMGVLVAALNVSLFLSWGVISLILGPMRGKRK
jgi:hypothetical protein